MVTEQLHAVVGVPVMAPVEVLIVRPTGNPVADHEEMVAVDDESEADGLSVEMALPDTSDWVPGLVTDTVLAMLQVKVAEPVVPTLSVAVMVTEQLHAVVGVPVMAPDVALMTRPTGSPVADHDVMVAADDESVAEGVSVEMALPDTWEWVPGLVTDTVLVTVHANEVEPE